MQLTAVGAIASQVISIAFAINFDKVKAMPGNTAIIFSDLHHVLRKIKPLYLKLVHEAASVYASNPAIQKRLSMNIYLLLAHPDTDSFNGQLADAYEKALLASGHKVCRQNIGEMQFDPILRKGYSVIQELEPDLIQAQENILWCDTWIIIYPVWWGSVPAILKGFLDRAILPGFGFKYHTNDPFWDKYLKGRSAHVIATSDAPAIYLWWQYGNSDIKTIKNATLEFCGIRPVKVTRITRVKYLDEKKRRAIIQNIVRHTPKL